jgi:hypothetical protein
VTPDDRALAALVSVLVDGGTAQPAPVARVRAHFLGPLAYRHGRPEFRSDFAASSIRADQQRATAAEAVEVLAAAGIPVALLKGISYAGWLYADPGERPMSDVDLLVPAAAHPDAVRALARLGYWHPGPSAQRSPRHHAMTLKRRAASVDLHRSPVQRGRLAIDWDALWSRTSPAPWIPGALRLSLVDEVLFHFANLTRHDLIAPLLAYVDAARLLVRLDDRGPLLDRAHSWGFGRALTACLEVVETVVGWRTTRPRWWLPASAEVLQGGLPPRPLQILRKGLLLGNPRQAVAFLGAVLDGFRR